MTEKLTIELDIAKSLQQLKDNPALALEMNKMVLGSEIAEQIEMSERIYDLVRNFIDEYEISRSESIYEDLVCENALFLVEDLVEIVGYYEETM